MKPKVWVILLVLFYAMSCLPVALSEPLPASDPSTLPIAQEHVALGGERTGGELSVDSDVVMLLTTKATKVKKVKITVKKTKLYRTEKFQFVATVSPASASQKVTWKSSNKKIASVSKTGVVTGKKKGKAVITARTKSGKKASVKVTVRKEILPAPTVTPTVAPTVAPTAAPAVKPTAAPSSGGSSTGPVVPPPTLSEAAEHAVKKAQGAVSSEVQKLIGNGNYTDDSWPAFMDEVAFILDEIEQEIKEKKTVAEVNAYLANLKIDLSSAKELLVTEAQALETAKEDAKDKAVKRVDEKLAALFSGLSETPANALQNWRDDLVSIVNDVIGALTSEEEIEDFLSNLDRLILSTIPQKDSVPTT